MLILLDLSVLPEEDDRELFRAFHRRYEDGLYALLLQTLGDPRRAEDGLQTVMVAILRQFPTLRRLYDTDRAPSAPGPSRSRNTSRWICAGRSAA